MKLGSRLLIGALAGIAGTMAMGATVRRLQKRLPARRARSAHATDEPTSRWPDGPAPDLKLVVHFAYGAGCGALLAAVQSAHRPLYRRRGRRRDLAGQPDGLASPTL